MRVLVAISILAFVALLWASIAIYRHIRRTQRRRRRALEASLNNFVPPRPVAVIAPPIAPPIAPEITFSDPEAPLPEVAFTDPAAPIRLPTAPPFQSYRQPESRPQPAPVLVTRHNPVSSTALTSATSDEFVDTLPPPIAPPALPIPVVAVAPPPAQPIAPRDPVLSPLPAWPHFGFTPAPTAQPVVKQSMDDDLYEPERIPISTPEPIPYAAPPLTESSSNIPAARGPIQIQPPAPAIKPIYPSSYPTVTESSSTLTVTSPPVPPRHEQPPMRRADWAYFNKDMGDLSDPPPAGSRPRIQIPKSD